MKYEVPIHQKECLTADEAAALSGLPVRLLRSEAYLARERPKISDFPALWIGDKLMIPRQPFITWIANQGNSHRRFNLAEAREITRSLNSKKNNQGVGPGKKNHST